MNINLDNHTSTHPCKAVLEFLQDKDAYYSPHCPHKLGAKTLNLLEDALESLHFRKKENTYFFPSWQEAIDRLFFALYFNEISETGKNQILLLETEDAPMFYAAEKLKQLGCEVKLISLDKKGNVDLESLQKAINPKTCFFSISYANGLTGTIYPINQIGKICKDNGVKLHLDLSYVLGKIFIDFESLPVDFITLSSHLIHGPKGACLLTKRKDFFSQSDLTNVPLWSQDPHFAKAFSLAVKQTELFVEKMALEVTRLKKEFEKKITEGLEGVEVLFKDSLTLPNVSVIYFPKIHAEALLYKLNKKGLFATFGGGVNQPLFTVLEKSGMDKYKHSSLSFAFSRYNTIDEITKAANIIIDEVKLLFEVSIDL